VHCQSGSANYIDETAYRDWQADIIAVSSATDAIQWVRVRGVTSGGGAVVACISSC
jgi:hypothetical protein